MHKKILFRADSSSQIGLGHIKRDLVLADRLSSHNISFATQELPGNINHQIPYPLHILKSSHIDELIALCQARHIDHLIVDNYTISLEDEKKIKEACACKLSVFDDTYNAHFCDEVINHNLGASVKKYTDKVPSFCKILLIPPLIRQEFLSEKKRIPSREGIFLSLGGSDPKNLTLSVLKMLKPHQYHVNVALTSSNENLPALKTYANVNRWVKLHIDANIAKLMNECELAIVTPSVLAAEALYMNRPLITIKTADNQREVERFIKRKGFETLEPSRIHKLRDPYHFQKRRPRHIPTAFKDDTFTLHTASKGDLLDLFLLANDPLVRKNSFSTRNISFEEHTQWLFKVLKDPDIFLYTGRSSTHQLISQIRFNKTDKKAIISLSISRKFRGRALAAKIITQGCKRFLKSHPNISIEAQIKEENFASQKSFQKAGFQYFKHEGTTLYYRYGQEHE